MSKSAGAHVVGSNPSRNGSLIEEFHPLQLYLDSLPASRTAIDALQAAAFAFSPLNAMPKIALGKWRVEEADHALIFVGSDNSVRIMPTGDLQSYYAAIIGQLSKKRQVNLVPEYITQNLKRHYKVSKQHDEYVMLTEDVRTLPGGRNAALRNNVNKARRLCTVEAYDPDLAAEYKALVKVWYQQNTDLKFRTYDKTTIDWTLENWSTLVNLVPDIVCLGIRHGVQLISLSMGCVLSDRSWTAYTQRFDRDAPVKAGNMLGYTELAKRFETLPEENDGTADTKTIREWKERLVASKVSYFTVKP